MTLPQIRSNGTGKHCLTEGYGNASDKLLDFIDAFERIEFNPRDYYTQGEDAYGKARDERDAINQKILEIRQYINAHLEALY